MKVYVVMCFNYGDNFVDKIFKTKELAKEYLKQKNIDDRYDEKIDEIEVLEILEEE